MSEMVERVARAICKTIPDALIWEHSNKAQREAYRQQARAAVEAMREPTEGMCEAGQQVNNIAPESAGLNAFEYLSRDEMTEAWQAMIDGALK